MKDFIKSTLFIVLGLLAASALSFCGHFLTPERWPVIRELLLHIAIALLIAAILTASVERITRIAALKETRRLQMDIAKSVLTTVLEKLIPPELVDEYKAIIGMETIRRNCHYRIEIRPPQQGMSKDLLIIRRSIWYDLFNLQNFQVTHTVGSSIETIYACEYEDDSGKKVKLPRHIKLEINDVDIPLDGTVLREDKDHKLLIMQKNVSPAQDKKTSVHFISEEPVRIDSGGNSYLQVTPLIGLSITVVNFCEEWLEVYSVDLYHARPDELKKDRGRHTFSGTMVPGQAFEIKWRPRHISVTESEQTGEP